MNLKRRRPEPFGIREELRLRSHEHLKFVRGFTCILFGKDGHFCEGKPEAAHVRVGTDGALGIKPSDHYTYPACSKAHREQHTIGEPAFERKYGVNLRATADRLWQLSPARKKLERQQGGAR